MFVELQHLELQFGQVRRLEAMLELELVVELTIILMQAPLELLIVVVVARMHLVKSSLSAVVKQAKLVERQVMKLVRLVMVIAIQPQLARRLAAVGHMD